MPNNETWKSWLRPKQFSEQTNRWMNELSSCFNIWPYQAELDHKWTICELHPLCIVVSRFWTIWIAVIHDHGLPVVPKMGSIRIGTWSNVKQTNNVADRTYRPYREQVEYTVTRIHLSPWTESDIQNLQTNNLLQATFGHFSSHQIIWKIDPILLALISVLLWVTWTTKLQMHYYLLFSPTQWTQWRVKQSRNGVPKIELQFLLML